VVDKQALCEMNVMKLEATHTSMQGLYEDTLERHEKLIQKLKESDDFKDVDLGEVDVSYFDEIPKNAGPRGMLCALRGLPFSDSIRHIKSSGSSSVKSSSRAQRKELIIHARGGDDESVNSNLTDDGEDFESMAGSHDGSGDGEAPWNTIDPGLSPKKRSGSVEKVSMKEGLLQPPSTVTTRSKSTPEEAETKPTPSVPAEKSEAKEDESEEEPVPLSDEEDGDDDDAEKAKPVESTPSTPHDKGAVAGSKVDNGTESVETNPCSLDSEVGLSE
jgi:hypothetical protein